MTIELLTREESLGILERSHLARLGCSNGQQPYVVPINYVLEGDFAYGFSTYGRKIDWMRANPKVCLEIDDIVHNRHWETVVATGEYEELPNTPAATGERHRAWQLLQARPNWWQPGFVKTVISGVERPLVPIFFRIRLVEVTGHRLALGTDRSAREKPNLGGLLGGLLGRSRASVTETQ